MNRNRRKLVKIEELLTSELNAKAPPASPDSHSQHAHTGPAVARAKCGEAFRSAPLRRLRREEPREGGNLNPKQMACVGAEHEKHKESRRKNCSSAFN